MAVVTGQHDVSLGIYVKREVTGRGNVTCDVTRHDDVIVSTTPSLCHATPAQLRYAACSASLYLTAEVKPAFYKQTRLTRRNGDWLPSQGSFYTYYVVENIREKSIEI